MAAAAALIDHATFDQLLEMDDDDKREFSKSVVWNYFEQAETTFNEMDEALLHRDLPTLSSKGHFLKGSSAVLGVVDVREACERIQNFGARWDLDGKQLSAEEALSRVEESLRVAKMAFAQAEQYFRAFYRVPA